MMITKMINMMINTKSSLVEITLLINLMITVMINLVYITVSSNIFAIVIITNFKSLLVPSQNKQSDRMKFLFIQGRRIKPNQSNVVLAAFKGTILIKFCRIN